MTPYRARLIAGASALTLAATIANHWPTRVDTTVRAGNHDGQPFVEMTCYPFDGPRVLVVGGSAANGWGASKLMNEWWVLACERTGGTWRNAAQPAKRIADEVVQVEENRESFRPTTVLSLSGGNDLLLGLAPSIRGQLARRVVAYHDGRARLGAAAARAGARLVTILQPLDLTSAHPSLQTAGYEAQLTAAYAEMARAADVDLSQCPVDFLDLIHFGDRGHAAIADHVAEVLK